MPSIGGEILPQRKKAFSIIESGQANEVMRNRTLDKDRITKIMNMPEQVIKPRSKLSYDFSNVSVRACVRMGEPPSTFTSYPQENGVQFPLRLHIIQQYRKQMMEEII